MRQIIIALLTMAFAAHAQAEAYYMPNTNAYAPQQRTASRTNPAAYHSTQRSQPPRVNLYAYRDMPHIPVYREAMFRQPRIVMPRKVHLPRNFGIDRNPAGPTPR